MMQTSLEKAKKHWVMHIFLLPQSINCLSKVQQFTHPVQGEGGEPSGVEDPGGNSDSQGSLDPAWLEPAWRG